MKVAIIALVLAVSLAQTEAYWGYGYGGLYGGLWGGLYGGLYGGYYGGLYGGYGYGYWGKREVSPPTEILERTECIYSIETRMLSCHGPSGIVECSTELTWTEPIEFQMFSLGLYTEASSPMKYRIMPRKVDNSGWESASYLLDGEKRFASLYLNEDRESGLKVTDAVCFQKIVDLLALSKRRELVEVDSEQVYVIGDLMVAKKMPVEEREEETKAQRDIEIEDEDDEEYTKRSVGEEIKEMKVRMEEEWSLVERNTETLMNALNKVKRQLDTLMNEQTPVERRDNSMWRQSNMMSDNKW